jgi:tRNA dimethylallyltransferase
MDDVRSGHASRQLLIAPLPSYSVHLAEFRHSVFSASGKTTLRLSPISTPVFVIAGPTAVGKSALAVAVAECCEGEIVGADAFQVYRGLDLLTAKPASDLLDRVPHHLIGEIPLTHSFDVAQYLTLARARIEDIHDRGRLPIVVGGTGLYLRALSRGLADLPGADAELRAELEKQPLVELQQQLTALDPAGVRQIDLQNPRRVIRALEVCRLTGRPFSSFREEWANPAPHIRGIVLTMDRAALHERIALRTKLMFAAGVVEEVRTCGETGPTASQTLGLREIRALIAGEMDPAACSAAIQQSTGQYAKRQMTWFRREAALTPIEIAPTTRVETLAEMLAKMAAG